ncbi:MAG: 50S ribosomal protein L13 [Nitrospinota bacterium]
MYRKSPMLTKEQAPGRRRWVVVDAQGQTLGRLASRVAVLLRGKHRPDWTPHVDSGDFVVVVNAAQVVLTGRKLDQKKYYRHSGYPGHLKEISARRIIETRPERLVEYAVRGMLPKTKLGRAMFQKLKVYGGSAHPHAAQRPEPLSLT